ncbi:cdkn1a interacting zinc finger protein 1b isoform X1 [Kryptolebias marmoratus]|uniref:Cip1-interacting zinc finger protein-like n=1 Tax=Kryptolebias marmoratus TaxID=37003 RepID=A0A3Q2ZZE5_KRYMA|nr:cdkn1a interacting zinc finger protein 1b isoform X1 [Kryptolebias marmoratus]
MVKQTRRTDRCFLPAAGGSVAKVRFPVSPSQRGLPPPQQVSGSGSSDGRPRCSAAATEEKGRSHAGGQGSDGGSGEPESKRGRQERNEEAAGLTNRGKAYVPGRDQQGAAELGEDSRAAQLQSVGSLKVTIQRSSESREFGPTDRTADRQTGGLHCHVCNLTCRSPQVFQEHMSGQEHLRKLQEITHTICLNTHTLLDRGRRPQTQHWCDTCQIHFTGDVIIHRRTKQHKACKQLGRPFCPVCKRHFRTPRKFVEHMKSAEHKEQVQLAEAQEEELITVDAVGCFEEEEEEQEEEVEVADEEEPEENEGKPPEPIETKEADEEEHDLHGSRFVVPVCGFVCRLCNKFFYREAAARHTHCRTHTHYLNVQNYRRTQEEDEGEDRSAPP